MTQVQQIQIVQKYIFQKKGVVVNIIPPESIEHKKLLGKAFAVAFTDL